MSFYVKFRATEQRVQRLVASIVGCEPRSIGVYPTGSEAYGVFAVLIGSWAGRWVDVRVSREGEDWSLTHDATRFPKRRWPFNTAEEAVRAAGLEILETKTWAERLS